MKEKVRGNELDETKKKRKNRDRRDRKRVEWRGRTVDYVITSERQEGKREREER